MKKLDKFWVALDRLMMTINWWYVIAIMIVLIVGWYNVSRWIDYSDMNGRFMRTWYGVWECVK